MHTFSCPAECNSFEVIFAIFTSPIFSLLSSTNLSTNLFLNLQFSWSKYSPTSHDLSHSHSQLLGFQINLLAENLYQSIFCIYTSIYLYSNVVYYYKTFASNLYLHLHVSCHFTCLDSLDLEIKLNTLTFMFLITSHFCIWIINIVAITATFTSFNTKRINNGLITINTNKFWFYFTFVISH